MAKDLEVKITFDEKELKRMKRLANIMARRYNRISIEYGKIYSGLGEYIIDKIEQGDKPSSRANTEGLNGETTDE